MEDNTPRTIEEWQRKVTEYCLISKGTVKRMPYTAFRLLVKGIVDGEIKQPTEDEAKRAVRPKRAVNNIRPTRLDDEKVKEIKRAMKAGEKVADIAEKYGTSTGAIYCIGRGETWSHVVLDEETVVES